MKNGLKSVFGKNIGSVETKVLSIADELFGGKFKNNVKNLANLTDDELTKVIKSAGFKSTRKSFISSFIASGKNNQEIDRIINNGLKQNLTPKMIKYQLTKELNLEPIFSHEIYELKVPKVKGGGKQGGGSTGGGNLNRPPLPTGGQQMPPLPPNFPNPGGVNWGNMYNMVQYVNSRSVSQIASRLKNKFPKAPDNKINEIAQNLKNANAYSEMEYNQMFDEAVAGFTPEYEKILLKPTAKTILGKIWQSSPRWVKVLIALTLIGGANEFFNLFGYNVGDFSSWFTSTWKNFVAQFGKGVVKGGKKPIDDTKPNKDDGEKPSDNNKSGDVDMSKY